MLIIIHGEDNFNSIVKLNSLKKAAKSKGYTLKSIDLDILDESIINTIYQSSEEFFSNKHLYIFKRISDLDKKFFSIFYDLLKHKFANNNSKEDVDNIAIIWEEVTIKNEHPLWENKVTTYFFPLSTNSAKEAKQLVSKLNLKFELDFDLSMVQKVTDYIGYDKFTILNEMKKLFVLKNDKRELNESNVQSYLSSSFEMSPQNLLEYREADLANFARKVRVSLSQKDFYNYILAIWANSLMNYGNRRLAKNLMLYDFQFKSGIIKEEDVFILSYKDCYEKKL
ncbi:hypothetical protein IPJ91_02240 [bacterium]|nr:MAG: hypothetical protein IPJ91_02240 [bacterium]